MVVDTWGGIRGETMRHENSFRNWCVMAAMATVLPSLMCGQAAAAADSTESKANAAYTSRDWATAENLYETLTEQNPKMPRLWYRLAVSARGDRHFDAAIGAFMKSRELAAGQPGALPPFLFDYELAESYAGKEDAGHALELLKSAANGGFAQMDRLQGDAEWSALRADPRFVAAEKVVKHNAAPCEDAEFHQFDFWLGDWDVVSNGDNTPGGASHIASEMGGCVIWENWTSLNTRYFGKSYNTYNVNLHRWEQYWVDNSAGPIFFHGGLKDGVMDYWTDDVPQPNGDKLRRHLQFIQLGPDKVRQFSRGSTDGGKTWNVEYDFIYNRRGVASAGAQ